MIFAFEFQLTIDKLTKPAAEAKKSVDAVTSSLRSMQKAAESAEHAAGRAGPKIGRGFGGERVAREATNSARKIADEWQKMAVKAERDEARSTRAKEREAAKRMAIQERESKAAERMWTRIAFAAQKAQDRAAEAAARKPWFGGHKSVMDLLSSRASAKASGMATGIADAALGLPGMIAGGIGGLALGGIKMAAGAALDLVSYSADAAMNFAKMAISAQALREQSVASFASVYGDQGVAEKLFKQSVRIAKITKFDTPDVVAAMNTLAVGRFKSEQLPMMFSAYGDITSARGSGKGAQFLRAVNDLNMAPTASWAAFKRAGESGPGPGEVMDALAERMGLAKDRTLRKRLMQKFGAGEIDSGTAINAVLDAVQRTYDKREGGGLDPLGTFTRKQGEGTWEGLISNIRNSLNDVLTMKLPDNHPMLRFKGILREINTLFDDQTERGRRFEALMSKLVEDVFMVFDIDPSKTGKAMENLLGLAEALEVKVRSVAEWLRDNVSRPLAEGLSGDLGGSLATKLKSGFIDLGITLGKAVAVGMFEAMGLSGRAQKIAAALRGTDANLPGPTAQSTVQYPAELNTLRSQQGLHPIAASSGAWDTGGWQIKGMGAEKTADAMGLPKYSRGGRVDVPTIALVGERGPEIIEPEGRRRGGVVIQGNVVIQMPPGSVTGYTEQDAQRLGTAFMGWLAQQGA